VSVHSIVPEEGESVPRDTLGLNPDLPVLVTSRAAPARVRSDESLLGALGLTVIIAIVGLAAYLGLRYLL